MAVVVGSYFYMGRVAKFEHSKERRPARISRNHHHDPNSPYAMGADGEMINMGSVGNPKIGFHFSAAPQTLYADKNDISSLENPRIWIIWNGVPTRQLFSRLGCAATLSPTSRLPSTPAPVVDYDGGRRSAPRRPPTTQGAPR